MLRLGKASLQIKKPDDSKVARFKEGNVRLLVERSDDGRSDVGAPDGVFTSLCQFLTAAKQGFIILVDVERSDAVVDAENYSFFVERITIERLAVFLERRNGDYTGWVTCGAQSFSDV